MIKNLLMCYNTPLFALCFMIPFILSFPPEAVYIYTLTHANKAKWGEVVSNNLTDLMIHFSSFCASGEKTPMSVRSVVAAPMPTAILSFCLL